MVSQSLLARSMTAGFAAGLRSQVPFAALAWKGSGLPWLQGRWGKRIATTSALGELVVDKLPVVPSRIERAPLVGRIGFGAAAGALTAKEAGATWATGAAAGAGAALVGAYVGFLGRTSGARLSGLPDPVLALVEDALAWALALAAAAKQPKADLLSPEVLPVG